MKVIVLGGTGKVGRHIVSHLRECGHDAHSAARSNSDVDLDMLDPSAVERAAHGYDAAFFITPLGPHEPRIGLAIVDALQAADVGKIGYLGIHNLDAMRAIPHFETKIPIRDAVLSTPRGVVVAPNFFFQNDMMMLSAMTHGGVYPLPVGSAGVFSVDVADIGRAAARALMHADWDGTMVPVCGTEPLTGPSMAASWTAALGRPVRYGGDDIGPFIGMMSQVIPGFGDWERDDFTRMMAVTQELGCPATDADIAASRAVIGREPRRYADFVTDLVQGVHA